MHGQRYSTFCEVCPIPAGPGACLEFREREGSRVFKLRREHFDSIGAEWTNLDADGEVLGQVRRRSSPDRLEIDAPDWEVIPRDCRSRVEARREAKWLFDQVERIAREREERLAAKGGRS